MKKLITGLILVGIVFGTVCFFPSDASARLFGRRIVHNVDCDQVDNGGRRIRPKPTPDDCDHEVTPIDKVTEVNTIIKLKKEIAELKAPKKVESKKSTINSIVAGLIGLLIGVGVVAVNRIKDIKKRT